ncbi:tRNA (adenosine(37)-N6)-threonylcarbamoyltransferase complex dimerization subunit type 1 TsaB [Asaia sp. W19]|nr:tRNA (adenosine(37)-N6)-threonylcarbamoyltransferase complex dimerization subunit type 1 TsaB [Asaia sp. W19]RUT25009.1 tRNA (adenosine(37)-N6)-threonylcarbamoyltransferase complex dimerization subunit type 1 TsaB [Asaia sp. W19]
MPGSGSLRCLVLNGATLGAGASGDIALFDGAFCVAHERLEGLGATAFLAAICRNMLRAAAWLSGPDLIVAVTGPGSFTGLRASLAFANGLSAGYGARLRGVTTGQCYRARPEWAQAVCVTHARRNRIFAEFSDGRFWAGPPDSLDLPDETHVIGNGVASLSGAALRREELTHPDITLVLKAGLAVADSPSLQPVYVDAPEAKLPAQGLRPAPSVG